MFVATNEYENKTCSCKLQIKTTQYSLVTQILFSLVPFIYKGAAAAAITTTTTTTTIPTTTTNTTTTPPPFLPPPPTPTPPPPPHYQRRRTVTAVSTTTMAIHTPLVLVTITPTVAPFIATLQHWKPPL
jgi:hypothetical protein